jgi:hypothetical protein
MKLPPRRPRLRPGYVSYIIVLTTGVMLTLMTMSAYRGATQSQVVQSETQIRVDYADKEDAVLRAVVNLVPNRAIRAMQHRSNISGSALDSLRWQNIFSDALNQANARSSISAALRESVGGIGAVVGNVGDSALASMDLMFDAIEPESGFVAPGLNRSLGAGFPVPLQTANETVATRDRIYPIISSDKVYGNLASAGVALPVASYPALNVIPYPDIRFGYSAPGQPFVAKRNWWAFSMQLGEHDSLLDSFGRQDGSVNERDFIVSIYEIPSQLAISAEAFTKLGAHADGTPWQHANIQGGVYATRAEVDSGMHIDRLSGRRGLTLGGGVTVGDNELGGNPFEPGVRERFEVTNGSFLPVTLASESGRAAFFPINRGKDFFDRFAHAAETDVLSTTSWNNYSVGALQCAMRLDITAVASSTDPTPTALRFQYFRGGVRQTLNLSLTSGPEGLPVGYVRVANENQSYTFFGLNDVAYGIQGQFAYRSGVTGTITFNNQTFGDPFVGRVKGGFFRPTFPFEVKLLHGTKRSIAIYPERFPAFLQALGADSTAVNHSLVVNVDYSTSGLNSPIYKPAIPATANDYAVLMTECDDLTGFTRGFSLVTNLRLYIGDDFNVVATAPPAGSGLPAPFYPPASLFAPEKRYGTDFDPFRVQIAGQIGHLGGEDDAGQPVHLLDLKMASEESAAAANIDVNLRPITHPAELPPVTMMNWLVMIEERRKALYTGTGAN